MDNIKDIIAGLNIERKPHLRIVTADYGVCNICKGAGYTRLDVPYGHPEFGKAQMCECRKAVKKAEQQQALLELSGLLGLKRFQHASFSTFQAHVPGCRDAYQLALDFSHAPTGWLVLLGPYGCGKTHLAVSIAKRRVDAGDTVLLLPVPDLLDHLRSAFSRESEESYDARFEQMKRVEMLVLDDYGAQNATPWATEKLFQLLNHRYNGSRATVITSNNMGLADLDPRIYSRLCDRELVTVVRMEEARDYRIYGDREEEEQE